VLFNALIFAVIVGLAAFFIGWLLGNRYGQKEVREAEARHEKLKRNFDMISAANLQLLRRHLPAAADQRDENPLQRFLEHYDEAKHRLHRALDRHNATAMRPVVISRDGGNILDALDALPELSFDLSAGEDAGLRSWVRRVIALDLQRRANRDVLRLEQVVALEGERQLWSVAEKQRA
jgi:hypothetical protein